MAGISELAGIVFPDYREVVPASRNAINHDRIDAAGAADIRPRHLDRIAVISVIPVINDRIGDQRIRRIGRGRVPRVGTRSVDLIVDSGRVGSYRCD